MRLHDGVLAAARVVAGRAPARTCCTETALSNCSMTTVPPANSTPLGMPSVHDRHERRR